MYVNNVNEMDSAWTSHCIPIPFLSFSSSHITLVIIWIITPQNKNIFPRF